MIYYGEPEPKVDYSKNLSLLFYNDTVIALVILVILSIIRWKRNADWRSIEVDIVLAETTIGTILLLIQPGIWKYYILGDLDWSTYRNIESLFSYGLLLLACSSFCLPLTVYKQAFEEKPLSLKSLRRFAIAVVSGVFLLSVLTHEAIDYFYREQILIRISIVMSLSIILHITVIWKVMANKELKGRNDNGMMLLKTELVPQILILIALVYGYNYPPKEHMFGLILLPLAAVLYRCKTAEFQNVDTGANSADTSKVLDIGADSTDTAKVVNDPDISE